MISHPTHRNIQKWLFAYYSMPAFQDNPMGYPSHLNFQAEETSKMLGEKEIDQQTAKSLEEPVPRWDPVNQWKS